MRNLWSLTLLLTTVACTHNAKPELETQSLELKPEARGGATSYVYDPKTQNCVATGTTVDALLDQMRSQVGNECFNLVASDLGVTRVMCPQIQVQLIVGSKVEPCMKGSEEAVPDYKTIGLGELNQLKPPTPQQLAMFRMKSLRGAIAMYRYHTGSFPPDSLGLSALLTAPIGTKGWQGPYVENDAGFQDPWHGALVYKTYDAGRRYTLQTKGPDQILGTADDQEFRPYPP